MDLLCVAADVNIGVIAMHASHTLKQLDTGLVLACEHCMVAERALCDVWVSLRALCHKL